ncbi:hypothetical protein D9M68_603400 [compost metagenome]
MAGASAQPTEPAVNTASAVRQAPRGPRAAKSRTERVAPRIEPTTNRVVLQAYQSSPPISRTTEGSTVVTMWTLTACSATPPVSASARQPLRPLNSSRQAAVGGGAPTAAASREEEEDDMRTKENAKGAWILGGALQLNKLLL